MRLKITKNKFGELSGSPIFEDGKVIFPSFTNPEIAQEGEEWEVELIKLIPLNKVDKKGQPMFKGIFVLKNKIYSHPNSLATALFGESNKVFLFDEENKIFNLKCGEHFEQFPARLVSRRFETFYGEVWERLEFEPDVKNGKVDFPARRQIINRFSPPFNNLPIDTPQEIIQKALENYNVILEKENSIKQKYAYRNNYINNNPFPKNYKLLLATGNYEIIKLNEGNPLSPLNGHEYDVFRIGDCKFIPHIKFIDEEWLELDDPPFSVDGDKDTIWRVMDYIVAPDFVGGKHGFFFKLFGIEEPDFNGILQARFLYAETVKSSFAYETLRSQGDETTHHTDYDEAIKGALEFQVPEDIKEVIIDNELFTIHYVPTIIRGLFEEADFEEGVGAKDATWYFNSHTFAGVFLYYETKTNFKLEVCERFAKEVKTGFTAQTNLPSSVRLINKLNKSK